MYPRMFGRWLEFARARRDGYPSYSIGWKKGIMPTGKMENTIDVHVHKLSSVVDGQAGSTIVQASQDGESLANAGDPVRSPPAQRDGNGAVRQ